MKMLKPIATLALAASFLLAPAFSLAAEAKGAKVKAKPYPLKTCLVSDEKFGGDMGEPYVFVHEGREVKLCCKSCRKDFDKDTAKFIKKLDTAAKKPK